MNGLPLTMVIAVAAAFLPDAAFADEMELGIHYSCDKEAGQLRIIAESRSGGGQEDPFPPSDDNDIDVLWNYDRLRAPLPIRKRCALGKRTLITVIAKGCMARQGGGAPTISVYADSASGRPFVHAESFGAACWSGPVVISEIRVTVPKDPHNLGLTVEMK